MHSLNPKNPYSINLQPRRGAIHLIRAFAKIKADGCTKNQKGGNRNYRLLYFEGMPARLTIPSNPNPHKNSFY
jgi:hypothetical protein